ncbi:hypothetical protein HY493_00505 [Candidatus Woesearchaeota archaeon]|nr:hypothetical protein [Candidatus Woesearchaeota archaeon]
MKRCALFLLLFLAACTSAPEATTRTSAQVDVQDADPDRAETSAPATSSLDCATLIIDSDMQGACDDVAAEEFASFPTESGCSYVKGINSLNADVSIPESGAVQASENWVISTQTWTGADPETVNVGVNAYYGVMAQVPHVWFVKGDYFVDVFSPLCSKEQLLSLATVVAGRVS